MTDFEDRLLLHLESINDAMMKIQDRLADHNRLMESLLSNTSFITNHSADLKAINVSLREMDRNLMSISNGIR